MDALAFLRERKRMCNLCKHCEGCPLERAGCGLGTSTPDEEYEKIIATVEQWSKEHPRKTRQSVFLEHYPDAPRDKDNLLKACPNCVDANVSCVVDKNATVKKLKRCDVCRREFWMQEVE